MSTETKAGWTDTAATAIIWGAILIGYVMNIWKIYLSADESITTFLLVRIMGIVFWPIGGIVGWF
jgi:hypothetical protein